MSYRHKISDDLDYIRMTRPVASTEAGEAGEAVASSFVWRMELI